MMLMLIVRSYNYTEPRCVTSMHVYMYIANTLTGRTAILQHVQIVIQNRYSTVYMYMDKGHWCACIMLSAVVAISQLRRKVRIVQLTGKYNDSVYGIRQKGGFRKARLFALQILVIIIILYTFCSGKYLENGWSETHEILTA